MVRLLMLLSYVLPLYFMQVSTDEPAITQPREVISEANLAALEQVGILQGSDDTIVQDIAFSSDGQWFAAIERVYEKSFDGVIRLWNTIEGFKESQLSPDAPFKAMSLAFSPEGHVLVAGDSSGIVTLVDLNSEAIPVVIQANDSHINVVTVSANNQFLAFAGSNLGRPEGEYAFKLIDLTSKEIYASLPTCNDNLCPGPGFSATFSPAENIVATASTKNGLIRVWDTESYAEIAALDKAVFWINDMIFTPDGTRLIYAASDGVRIWNMETALSGENLADFRVITPPEAVQFITSLALNPEGNLLTIGYIDGTIDVLNLETGEKMITLEGHTDRVLNLAFSPDGTLLASGGADGTVRLWGVGEG
ncbi:MAG: WD40 repeat domain-containing protein [Anaerolineae bacterium]|nr:WD40 repeat domain-containing protein [Anaerolineae bacterium]